MGPALLLCPRGRPRSRAHGAPSGGGSRACERLGEGRLFGGRCESSQGPGAGHGARGAVDCCFTSLGLLLPHGAGRLGRVLGTVRKPRSCLLFWPSPLALLHSLPKAAGGVSVLCMGTLSHTAFSPGHLQSHVLGPLFKLSFTRDPQLQGTGLHSPMVVGLGRDALKKKR